MAKKACDLCGVTTLLTGEPHLGRLIAELRAGRSRQVYGLPSSAHAVTTAALARALGVPVLLVTAYPDRALQLAEELPSWLGDADVAAPRHAGCARGWPSASERPALLFPALDALPYDRTAPELSLVQQRLLVLQTLGRPGAAPVVMASARALIQPLMDPQRFAALTSTYRVGQRFRINAELARWEEMGYQAVDVVTAQGQYARRGGIVDVFPGAAEDPVRIELFGDDIDSLRLFDPATQRSTARVDSLTVTAVRQYSLQETASAVRALRALDLSAMLPHTREQWEEDVARLENGLVPEGAELFAPYLLPGAVSPAADLPARSLLVLDEPQACWEAMDDLAAQARELRDELAGRGELPRGLRDPLLAPEEVRTELTSSLRVEWWTRTPDAGPAPEGAARDGLAGPLGYPAPEGAAKDGLAGPLGPGRLPCDDWRDAEVVVPALTYAGRLRSFLDDTLELREQGRRVVVATLQSARLSELYDEHGAIIPAVDGMQDAPDRGSLTLVQGSLLEGWRVPALGLHVFGDAEIFGWSKPAPVARFKREAAATTGGLDFKPGDYVVHIEHGIGRFHGVEKRIASGIEREYLELQYAGTDRLFVPTDQLDRVTRYVGMGEAAPALSRLGTAEWARAKARVKESVAAIARELVELYSFRRHAQGHPFAPDGRWQSEMEAAFPYVETIDQQRAIRDVKADMEAPRPMDRLVCG